MIPGLNSKIQEIMNNMPDLPDSMKAELFLNTDLYHSFLHKIKDDNLQSDTSKIIACHIYSIYSMFVLLNIDTTRQDNIDWAMGQYNSLLKDKMGKLELDKVISEIYNLYDNGEDINKTLLNEYKLYIKMYKQEIKNNRNLLLTLTKIKKFPIKKEATYNDLVHTHNENKNPVIDKIISYLDITGYSPSGPRNTFSKKTKKTKKTNRKSKNKKNFSKYSYF